MIIEHPKIDMVISTVGLIVQEVAFINSYKPNQFQLMIETNRRRIMYNDLRGKSIIEEITSIIHMNKLALEVNRKHFQQHFDIKIKYF